MRRRIIIISGALIILSALFFYFFLIWRVSTTLTEQFLYRKQLAAKAGAKAASIFVKNLGFQTSVFATRISIVTPNSVDTPKAMKNLVEGMEETPMTGVMLADSSGTVLYVHEKPGPSTGGEDISDREYFRWAQTAGQGEIFVGAPIISKLGYSEGRYIVPIATPVFKDGEFSGVLVVAFFLDEMADQYLEELKGLRTSDGTRVYIVDSKGTIISSPSEKLLGGDYFDYLEKKNIGTEALRSALASDGSGSIDIYLPDETKNGAMTRFLVGYAPIQVGDLRWLLAVATPATEALGTLYPFYLRDLGIIGIVVLVLLVIAFFLDKVMDVLSKSKSANGKKENLPLHNDEKGNSKP